MNEKNMIVIDSGLGGISVVRALRASNPALPLLYLADTAGFPYGKRSAEEITLRAASLVRALLARHPASTMVIACNTLSTLCLDQLRAQFSVPFVGTVPAIKTGAQLSKSRRFTLLATPNTAQSRYSSSLVSEFASDCVVDSYGAPNLAAIAEQMLLGESVDSDLIRAELAPCFQDDGLGKTDSIVLGCTHYPLILDALKAASPWQVNWIDSSEAIARRALSLADTPPATSIAYVTAAADVARYRDVFAREGFSQIEHLST